MANPYDSFYDLCGINNIGYSNPECADDQSSFNNLCGINNIDYSNPECADDQSSFNNLCGINPAEGGLEKPAANFRTVHITFSTSNRYPEFENQSKAHLMLAMLQRVAERHAITLFEVCVMPDHVHALLSFQRDRHLEYDIMKNFKGASSFYFRKHTNDKTGALWARKKHYKDVTSSKQFINTVKYIHQNPLKEHISQEGRILSLLTADF